MLYDFKTVIVYIKANIIHSLLSPKFTFRTVIIKSKMIHIRIVYVALFSSIKIIA